MMLSTDRQLARRSAGGDRTAFVELHRRHAPRVFNLLRRLTRDAETAEDLTQETFLAAYRSLAGWRGEGAFGTWICGIAFRLYRNHRRRTASDEPEPLSEDLEAAPSGSDPFLQCARHEAQRLIEEAIDGLPPLGREIFLLVRVEGLSYREASELLEVPLGTVQSRLSNATRLLRADLAQRAEVMGSDLPFRMTSGKENPDAL